MWIKLYVYCSLISGLRCHLDDACLSSPCHAGAICETSPMDGSYICSCPQGWYGEDCTLEVDECQESKKPHYLLVQIFDGILIRLT